MNIPTIYPVILSGGAGKRLWPLSTKDQPKQFHPLYSDKPIIVETALRFHGDDFAPASVICSHAHRFHVASTFDDFDVAINDIIIEPEAKNTAAAVYVAAKTVFDRDPDGLVLILPSDHYIPEKEGMRKAVREASVYCDEQKLITFGIKPDRPETGYGYIKIAENSDADIVKVDDFVEKPDRETAESYIQNGNYYWNAGIFLGSAKAFLNTFNVLAPEIVEHAGKAIEKSLRDLDFIRLDADSFAKVPSISFDYAIMEKHSDTAVKPISITWNDLGSWQALYDIAEKDADGNVVKGDVLSYNTTNSYLRNSNDRSLAVMGANDLIVISSQNAVVVAHKDSVQNIREVYEELEKINCPSIRSSIKRQPWGYSKTLVRGEMFCAKEIMLEPEERTAMQVHQLRSEHWVVIEGTATITIGEKTVTLEKGESVSVSPNVKHLIANNTNEDLVIFEVQNGEIEEEDILRVVDKAKITAQV